MSETTHTDHENMTRDHRTHAPVGHNHMGQGHTGHDHSTMIADFRRRFWVSLILTVPVLALSPLIQSLLGIQLRFPGDSYVLFGLSAIVFFYGGWPFLTGLIGFASGYRAMGYRELGQIPGYYQGIESAIRMARDLRALNENAYPTRRQIP